MAGAHHGSRARDDRVRTTSRCRLHSGAYTIPLVAVERIDLLDPECRFVLPRDDMIEAHGIYCYAGLAAEVLLDAAEHDREQRRRWGADRDASDGPAALTAVARRRSQAALHGDRERLAAWASALGLDRPADRFVEGYWIQAAEMLRARWGAVEALAAALLDRTTISGEEVDLIVCEAIS